MSLKDSMDPRIEELLPFYALDALTDEERELVDSYLAEHPEVREQMMNDLKNRLEDRFIATILANLNDEQATAFREIAEAGGDSEKMNQFNKQPHVGLENLRSRIKIMNEKYDMNCTLDIRDLSENNIHRTGTLATLRFKILTL